MYQKWLQFLNGEYFCPTTSDKPDSLYNLSLKHNVTVCKNIRSALNVLGQLLKQWPKEGLRGSIGTDCADEIWNQAL